MLKITNDNIDRLLILQFHIFNLIELIDGITISLQMEGGVEVKF